MKQVGGREKVSAKVNKALQHFTYEVVNFSLATEMLQVNFVSY